MLSRDNGIWLQFWRDKRTDFHLSNVNPLLSRCWSRLPPTKGNRVFVPLCGKSLDLLWLAKQGHEVIGVELSPIAVKSFFQENKLTPIKQKQGAFTLWRHGKISILCGDFFALTIKHLGVVDRVYDRAALTALPADIRKHYAAHLKQLMPHHAKMLLLTDEDADPTQTQTQTQTVDEELLRLFAEDFDIDLMHVESDQDNYSPMLNEQTECIEYKAYLLEVKTLT
jgi:thiopurine S-methyltransferase